MKGPDRFDGLFSDDVLRDYLQLNDRAMRQAVSRISAECEIMRNKREGAEDFSDEINGILSMCCRIMQISELHGMLACDTKKESEVISLTEYLEDFLNGCSELLDGVCEFSLMCSGEMLISVSKYVLTYILLLFVRQSVLDGAAEMHFSCTESGNIYSICARTVNRKKQEYVYFEDFQNKYYEDILRTASERLGAEITIEDECMKLAFPKGSEQATGELHSEKKSIRSALFSDFRVMLSDLKDEREK